MPLALVADTGVVETDAQIALVRAQTPLPPLPAEPTLEERVLGSLLGGAVGDGFGYEIEFRSLESIRRAYGDPGLLDPKVRREGPAPRQRRHADDDVHGGGADPRSRAQGE